MFPVPDGARGASVPRGRRCRRSERPLRMPWMEGSPGEDEDETAGVSARFAREGGMRVRPGVHRLPVSA